MTYEEAIKILELIRPVPSRGNGKPFLSLSKNLAIDIAIEALEKQIPKKPIDNHHCPSCETGLPHKGITDEWCKCCFDPDFCPECGQRLNWSDLK